MLGKIVDTILWYDMAKSLAEANIDPIRWIDEPLCRVIGFFLMKDSASEMTFDDGLRLARERNKLLKAQRDEEGERWQYH